jgi:hypothetical protein
MTRPPQCAASPEADGITLYFCEGYGFLGSIVRFRLSNGNPENYGGSGSLYWQEFVQGSRAKYDAVRARLHGRPWSR